MIDTDIYFSFSMFVLGGYISQAFAVVIHIPYLMCSNNTMTERSLKPENNQ